METPNVIVMDQMDFFEKPPTPRPRPVMPVKTSSPVTQSGAAPKKPNFPPPKHPLLTEAEFAGCVAAMKWRESTSKQYEKLPHSYHAREWTSDMKRFDRMVEHIRWHGFPHRFFSKVYVYLKHGDWYYWTMGWPVNETTVINRARKMV